MRYFLVVIIVLLCLMSACGKTAETVLILDEYGGNSKGKDRSDFDTAKCYLPTGIILISRVDDQLEMSRAHVETVDGGSVYFVADNCKLEKIGTADLNKTDDELAAEYGARDINPKPAATPLPPAPITVVKNFYEAVNARRMNEAMTLVADNAHFTKPYLSSDNKEDLRNQLRLLQSEVYTFELTNPVRGYGKVFYAYKVFRYGKEVETGLYGVTFVRDGKIISDRKISKSFWKEKPSESPFVASPENPVEGNETPETLKEVSTEELNRNAVKKVQPNITDLMKKMNESGTVNVKIVVDESGKVISAEWKLVTLFNPFYGQAAGSAAKQWEFKPFLENGQPIKARGTLVFNFK